MTTDDCLDALNILTLISQAQRCRFKQSINEPPGQFIVEHSLQWVRTRALNIMILA